jgi:hypothetical protein
MESLPLNLQEKYNNNKKGHSITAYQKVTLEKLIFLKKFSTCFHWNRVNRNDGPVELSEDQSYSEKLKLEFNNILTRLCEKLKYDLKDIIQDANFKKFFIGAISNALNHYLKGQYHNICELHEGNMIHESFGLTQHEMNNIISSGKGEQKKIEDENKEEEEKVEEYLANSSFEANEKISVNLYPLFPLKLLSLESKKIIS